MARKRELEPEVLPDTEAWLVTFSDLISLMLTFFVLLISMSTLDAKKLKNISSEFNGALLLLDAGEGTEPHVPPPLKQYIGPRITPQNMLLAMKQHSMAVFKHGAIAQKVKTIVLKDRFIMRIDSEELFEPGSATLKPRDVQVMKQLAHMLAVSPGNIRIEGHADNDELLQAGGTGHGGTNHGEAASQERRFPDAWSLSLARAASVLHVLVAEVVNPSRLSLIGYGSEAEAQTSEVEGKKAETMNKKGEYKSREESSRHVDIVLFKPGSQ